MRSITSLIRLDREYRSAAITLKEQLTAAKTLPIVVNGLSAGAAFAFLAESCRDAKDATGTPALLLVSDEDEAKRISAALSGAGLRARAYPARDLIFHSMAASHDTERERLTVLSAVLAGEVDVVVTTPAAAMLYTIPESLLVSLTFELRLGDTMAPEALEKRLLALGYAKVDMVDGIGQYARRGGILDVFVGGESAPVRLEFFGDEIDRMESFDPITQRVSGSVPTLSFLPAGETLVSEEARARILATVDRLLAKAKDDEIRAKLEKEKNALENRLPLEFRDKYEGLLYDGQSTLFSYFDIYPRTATYLLGTAGIRENLKKQSELLRDERAALLSQGLVGEEAASYFADPSDLEDFLGRNVAVHLNPFSGGVGTMRVSGLFGFRCRRTVSYGENASLLFEDLTTFRKALYRVLIVCENKQGAASLISSLGQNDFPAVNLCDMPDFDYNSMQNGMIYVTAGEIYEGYELMMAKAAVLSMAQDEGKRVVAARREARILRRAGGAGQRLMSYADLSVGDYVVHRKYGIGRFEGISTVTVDGATRDYITVQYAGTDTLFVPCDRLEMIGKYIGRKDSDGAVKLSKMGGTDWSRQTAKAKSAAKNIAKDLIRLYAERQRRPGFAFPKDSEMEEEFDASFEFAPTDSQLRAIEEIKADMERPVPMNRLLCGDVGFGKTEVALRAAFKAVSGGKQVAFLVPTTILALQHYQTALSRMRGYPVTVEMLSRFRTPKEEEAILRRLRRGEIDILIGTHKLLSKKIEFRDLGLLIIDEEQRFGVAQKEKLKEQYLNIDVLTLSATPIPRTLNMAMTGIRDMSIIEEA
ncbi:MAG TPA: transcription-repair coupling factor, partial [Clostridiales bacterium]|nr:transcription-repair coupling factor [Clostridiales bacterium]